MFKYRIKYNNFLGLPKTYQIYAKNYEDAENMYYDKHGLNNTLVDISQISSIDSENEEKKDYNTILGKLRR